MQGQGTAASMTEDFMHCLDGVRGNLGLFKTLVSEFAQQSARAMELLSEDRPDRHAIRVKIITVASIIAGMHKASAGEANKQARMIAAQALVNLNTFGDVHYHARFLDEERMGPVLAQDQLDRGGQPKKKAKRSKENSSSAQT